MPIKHLSETQVTQVCALCCAERAIPIASLTLGQTRGEADPDVINMPACPTAGCGAGEVLKRTWDTTPAKYSQGAFVQQRRAVNALAQLLLELGHTDPGCAALHAAEGNVQPPELLERAQVAAGYAPLMHDMSANARAWTARMTYVGDVHPARRQTG